MKSDNLLHIYKLKLIKKNDENNNRTTNKLKQLYNAQFSNVCMHHPHTVTLSISMATTNLQMKDLLAKS